VREGLFVFFVFNDTIQGGQLYRCDECGRSGPSVGEHWQNPQVLILKCNAMNVAFCICIAFIILRRRISASVGYCVCSSSSSPSASASSSPADLFSYAASRGCAASTSFTVFALNKPSSTPPMTDNRTSRVNALTISRTHIHTHPHTDK